MRAICLLVLCLGLCSGVLVGCSPLPSPPENCSEKNDTIAPADLLMGVKQQILGRLNLTAEPQGLHNRSEMLQLHASDISAFRAAVLSSRAGASRKARECGGRDEFFAKRVHVYSPSTFYATAPPADAFEWGTSQKYDIFKRGLDVVKDEEKEDDGEVSGPPEDPKDLAELQQQQQQQQLVPPLVYKLSFQRTEDISLAVSADLHLYKRKVHIEGLNLKRERESVEHVEVFHIYESTGLDGKVIVNSVLLLSKDFDTAEDGYVSFNITNTVRDWMRSEDSLELEVVIRPPMSITSGLFGLPVIEFDVPDNGTKDTNNAQLVVSTEEEKYPQSTRPNKRQAASPNSYCVEHPEEVNCCLREHTVNFVEDLGWSWIIYPPSYQSNYCQGLCPYLWPSASLSTTLLMRYKDLNPTAAPSPCCVPQELEPLTILAHINGQTQMIELTNMIVASCICR